MIEPRLKKQIFLSGIVMLLAILVIIDRNRDLGSYRAAENISVSDQCFESGVCPLPTSTQTPPSSSGQTPTPGTTPGVLPKSKTPTPTIRPNQTATPATTSTPNSSSQSQGPKTDIEYSFMTKAISLSLTKVAQFGFTQTELAWLGEEFLRSLIRADRQGRDYISSQEFDWIALILTEARSGR